MDFRNITELELAEFALDIRLPDDDRADIIAELVNRYKKAAYRQGYADGVVDAKNGLA